MARGVETTRDRSWLPSALTTEDLLALLTGLASSAKLCQATVARRVDAGSFATAAGHPDQLDIEGEAGEALVAAVLELARRAAIAPLPLVMRRPEDVAAVSRRVLGGRAREAVVVVVCDSANRHLRTVVVSEGSIDRAVVPVREILHTVLRCDGVAFAVAHNHVASRTTPSAADEKITRALERAARATGLRCLGHVVITSDGYQVVR